MGKIKGRKIGGLVLKRSELEKLLSEDDSVGLAFGLPTAGESLNVGLKIYQVTENEGGLVGEEREVTFQKGASSLGSHAINKEGFQFEHHEELRNNKFDFAFLEKSKFHKLFESGADQIFVMGAVRDYGNVGKIKGRYFTFAVTVRFDPALERDFGNPPDTMFMEGCPPFWEPDGFSGNGKILFRKRTH